MKTSGFIAACALALAAAAPVSAQEAEQAVEASAQPASADAAVPALEREWGFLRSYGMDKNDEVVSAVLPELEAWLGANPESGSAAEAQLLKARIHLRLGDYRAAIVDLLKHLQEYPEAASGPSARKLFEETAKKKLGEKNASVLNEIAKVAGSSDKAARLAGAFTALAGRVGPDFYVPLAAEFRSFFGRFPSYAELDALQLAFADLHSRKEEFIPARLAYEKLIQVYPSSRLVVKAKRSLGDVLANNLKEYDAAIPVYQAVAADYPGTEEAWAAYQQLAKLSERQKKYPLAVDTHEKIIALYPDKAAAYDSFVSEARILREEMSKHPEAVAVLGRLADKYKGEKAVEALYLAAKIAKKDMKDLATEIRMYERIAAEYAEDAQAPKALFAAAEAYENAGEFAKARDYYGKVSDKYPKDSLASKSQKRVNAIMNK